MITQDRIINEYFEWLSGLVQGDRYADQYSFRRLLVHLHDTEFRYLLPKDRNRATAGIDLRYRFTIRNGYKEVSDLILDYLDGPCSVLEMMVAVAMHCEERITDNPNIGDRTAQWFWGMITNLGLGSMTDSRYERKYVDRVINRFMDREYEPNGKGGLFTIRGCDEDLRDVEIFYQLCWYLNTII